MKKFTLFLLSIILTCSTFGLPITKKIAEKVALNLYFEKGSQYLNLQKDQISISDYQVLHYENEPMIYVFNMNDHQGFVMVTAESDVMPVLAYSFEGRFISNDLPQQIQSWINDYFEQIQQVRTLKLSATQEINQAWAHYTTADFVPQKSSMAVNPLLTTNWDQGCNYNALCPAAPGGDCGHVWVGCVATAMGMVMKYHNYPETGTGSHTYNHALYGAQTANFGGTTYQWGNMPDQVYSSNAAVATLLYHCGVSVNMNYGTSGSGAYTEDVRDALVNYFSYGATAQYVKKMWYSTSGWENLLISDLDSHLPIIYSGQDPSFGHAFVCDGYQGTNFFHFNWGWSGWNNGYFYVSNLNSGNGTFNTNQAAVVHIAPAPAGPLPSFNVSQTQFCAETTVQFHDNTTGNTSSWNWQFPGGNPGSSTLQNPLVTYSLPGNYDVTLTVSDGTNSNTMVKNNYIKVKTKPYANFPTDTTLCCNNTITLDAGNPGSSYTWSTGEITQNILLDSTGIGIGQKMITVEILTQEGCWNADTVLVNFSSCSGMDDLSLSFMIYPNPAEEIIILNNNLKSGMTSLLRIYNETGLLVKEEPITSDDQNFKVSIADLKAGVYILRLEQDSNIAFKKLIIK